MTFLEFITDPYDIAFFVVGALSLVLALKLFKVYKFTNTVDPLIFFFVMFFEFANMTVWLFLWGYILTFCGESLCFSLSWIWFHNAVAAMIQIALWYFLLLHVIYLHFRPSKVKLIFLSIPYLLVTIDMFLRWLFPGIREGIIAEISLFSINIAIPVISLMSMIIGYSLLNPQLKTKRTQRTRIAFILVNVIILSTYLPYPFFENLPGIYFILVGFLILGFIAVKYPQTFLISTAQIMSANELYAKIEKKEDQSNQRMNSSLIDYIENLKVNGIIS